MVLRCDAGPRPTPIVPGRVQLVSKNNNMAPLEENTQKVLLELTGGDSTSDRSGLDLVAVLDVSGSMQGEKIDKMKTAMKFVVKKLSSIDRLSIVTFMDTATRICPLRQVTDASQPELLGLIDALNPGGNTNITDGLQTGLKVLADRNLSSGRVVGVMLMSDGQQNRGGNAADVKIGNAPVYTFGFGADYDPTVLNAVARNSMGGTFSVVNDVDKLSMAFSQCLAGLLTVVVQDLTVTVTPVEDESTIQKVAAGNYPQTQDAGSVTVAFGDLYSKEVRKLIVDLLLPAIDTERGADILEVTYAYKTAGKLFDAPPATVTVRRSGSSFPADDPPVDVVKEEARLQTATMIKQARTMADGKKLGDALDKLVEAQNALGDVPVADPYDDPLLDALRKELQELQKLMKSPAVYEQQGRPYAMSSETSHDRQRFAARGDMEKNRLFATPRMDKYLEQAKKFDEDPAAPLPPADVDEKEEVAANPLAPLAGPITFYIQAAVQALQAIEKLINNGAKAV
jgi:uncharacterized protein YegL